VLDKQLASGLLSWHTIDDGNPSNVWLERQLRKPPPLLARPGMLIFVRIHQGSAFICSATHAEMVGPFGFTALGAGGDADGRRLFVGTAHIAS